MTNGERTCCTRLYRIGILDITYAYFRREAGVTFRCVGLCLCEAVSQKKARLSHRTFAGMSPVDYATAAHKFEPSTINKRPVIATMKLILSAWTIVVWAVVAPEIYASTYKEDKEIENDLMAGGDLFMQKTMLRQKRALSGQSRIVGGNDADIDKYPFFVEWDGCGASLVHKGKHQ